jgi:FSR family fosmidomycin resistance protein-like MFS transporter
LLGIFVAPGTLGIAIGTTLGAANRHPALIFAGLLVFATIVILMAGHPSRHTDNMDPPQKPPSKFWDLLSVAIPLLCAAVALRQIVGSFGGGAAKEWLYAVPIGGFLGKILGGILADRFGWHRFTVVVILLSAPLLFCASTSPLAGVVGSFLFTMSMPVTLAALAVLLPGRPGTAFGIASLALAFGGFACLFIADDHWTLFALVCLTAYLFHVGMLCYNERVGVIRSFSE